MTERIAVGDLVVVVNYCCYPETLGLIARVTAYDGGLGVCMKCYKGGSPTFFVDKAVEGKKAGFAPWMLKRIPPLSELEGVKADEPIKEPA